MIAWSGLDEMRDVCSRGMKVSGIWTLLQLEGENRVRGLIVIREWKEMSGQRCDASGSQCTGDRLQSHTERKCHFAAIAVYDNMSKGRDGDCDSLTEMVIAVATEITRSVHICWLSS